MATENTAANTTPEANSDLAVTANSAGEQIARLMSTCERYEQRIANQIQSINRILAGATYDDEMAALHDALAEAQKQVARLEELRDNEARRN